MLLAQMSGRELHRMPVLLVLPVLHVLFVLLVLLV